MICNAAGPPVQGLASRRVAIAIEFIEKCDGDGDSRARQPLNQWLEALTERHPNHRTAASNDRPIITLASGGPAARQIPACRAPTMHRAASAPPNRADRLVRARGWWQTVEWVTLGHVHPYRYPGKEVVTTTRSAKKRARHGVGVSHTAAFFFRVLRIL